MAIAAIPDEVAKHFEIALALSRRDVLLRFLQEAEVLIRSGQLAFAAVLAGVVLDEATRFLPPAAITAEGQINVWREMRNRAAHPGSTELTIEQVKAMVAGIRGMLNQADEKSQLESSSLPPVEDALAQIRGKYAFVQTSVDEFLKRKREDLDLEDRKCP
jgi:hypothetical protein